MKSKSKIITIELSKSQMTPNKFSFKQSIEQFKSEIPNGCRQLEQKIKNLQDSILKMKRNQRIKKICFQGKIVTQSFKQTFQYHKKMQEQRAQKIFGQIQSLMNQIDYNNQNKENQYVQNIYSQKLIQLQQIMKKEIGSSPFQFEEQYKNSFSEKYCSPIQQLNLTPNPKSLFICKQQQSLIGQLNQEQQKQKKKKSPFDRLKEGFKSFFTLSPKILSMPSLVIPTLEKASSPFKLSINFSYQIFSVMILPTKCQVRTVQLQTKRIQDQKKCLNRQKDQSQALKKSNKINRNCKSKNIQHQKSKSPIERFKKIKNKKKKKR